MLAHGLRFTLSIVMLSACCHVAASQGQAKVARYCFSEWCEKIGYSEAVISGNRLYLSGIVGDAKTMEHALTQAFTQLSDRLSQLNIANYSIVKEKIYTNNKAALRKATHIRKKFYLDEFPAAIWIETEIHRKNAWVEMEFIIELPSDFQPPKLESK